MPSLSPTDLPGTPPSKPSQKEHQPTNKKVMRPTMKQLSVRRLPTAMPGLLHGDASLVAPRRQDGRLVHEILEICSAEASRSLGNVQKRHLRQRAATLHRRESKY